MVRHEKGFVHILCMVFGLIAFVNGKRIKDSIYDDLNERAFCFRRTNGTNQMGCSSTPGGNVGVVHLISNEGDVDWLIGDQGIHAPYIAIIIPKMFTKETLTKLKSSGKIDGILLFGANSTQNDDLGVDLAPPTQYSDDSSCPNEGSSYYKEQACTKNIWNPFGSDILMEDWSFPIFLVDDHDKVTGLINCYNEYNKPSDSTPRSWPLCAAELKSHMISSVDTTTCLRRNSFTNPFSPTNFCDRMGDRNVFHMIHQENVTDLDRYPDQSVLMVSARLDGVNIFDKMEVGYGSPTSSIVALLATAELLNRDEVNFQLKSKKNVLFALLNGEAFDYIGSSRMVYDMENGLFPKPDDDEIIDDDKVKTLHWPKIDLNSLYGHLELGQLLKTSESKDKTYYAHMDKNNKDLNQDLLETLVSEAGKIDLTLKKSDLEELPPSSIHSVLKRKNTIPGILLSNYDSEYTNQYFHSIYDNSTNNGYDHDKTNQEVVEHLAAVAETVSATIFELFGKKNSGSQPTFDFKGKANKTLINDLIYCYTVTIKCNLFEAVRWTESFWNDDLPDFPFPQYVGVESSYTYHTTFTSRVLAYLTSKPIEDQNISCKAPKNDSIYHYQPIKGLTPPSWFSGNKSQCDANFTCGYCLKSTIWLSAAVSPAFVIDDYDYHNTTYGSWAESSWPRETSSRMFLKASPSREAAYLSLGIIMLLLSFTSVIWINIHATDIFEEGEQEVEPAAI